MLSSRFSRRFSMIFPDFPSNFMVAQMDLPAAPALDRSEFRGMRMCEVCYFFGCFSWFFHVFSMVFLLLVTASLLILLIPWQN